MSRQFCTFFLGRLYMGIEATSVQEVLRVESVTPVPLAHPAISGLINLRGRIVSAIDLRHRLAVTGERPDQPMNIILSAEDGTLSLVVDRVGDVVDVADSDFEEPPDTLRGFARRMIRGAYKLNDRLLLILDTDNALNLGDAAGATATMGGSG